MSKQDKDSFWKIQAFNSSFYPYSIKEWCALGEEIRNIVSVNKFREIILSFIRSKENSVFTIHDTKGLKLLTRLRLNLNNLNELKFRHGFRDIVYPMCKRGLETKQNSTFSCVAGCILLLKQNSWTKYQLLLHSLRITMMKNY